MEYKRSAGILLHPTSLPGKYGIGDLGENAYRFVDFMEKAGQKLWQVFPLGPTGFGDSPYQSFSAFAGNPLLISPDLLKEKGLLSDTDLSQIPEFEPHNIEFGKLINYKTELLKKAYANYKQAGSSDKTEYEKFCSENSFWLEDYALFMASKEYHGGVLWTKWDKSIAFREASKLDEWKEKLSDLINYQKFVQFTFFDEWSALRKYANEKGITIIGDMPIFIAYDSSDVWANRELFTVDEKGELETVAGVPPDYFSPTGQLWGNPLYRWDEMRKDNFSWWKKRFGKLFELVDIVRIDHFRGFEAFWEIPGGAPNAIKGKWVKAPGDELFTEIKRTFGDLPILAEDLGVITDEVRALRDKFGFPGMKILQFAFGKNGDKNFLPHNYSRNSVVYTGSHDNDTTKGFFDKAMSEDIELFEWTQDYLNYYGAEIVFPLIKEAYKSVANYAIIPMQDILNLGSQARMNFPGKLGGNWSWRFSWDQITEELASKHYYLCKLYER